MKALIVGLGNIGRRHLMNLRHLEPAAEITIWRQHTKPQEEPEGLLQADGTDVVYRLDDALERRPKVALITSPAPLHLETAMVLAERGIHLFIEKPLADRLEGVDELLDLCRRNSLALLVGYNFRFHRPLQLVREAILEGRIGRPLAVRAEVGQYLPEWRPGDYRRSVSARKDLGGGVILELSHELDYVRWLMGEVTTVTAQVGRLSDLEIDVEDTAEIICHFANGALGSIHLDMVQRPAVRTCRVIGAEGTISWDAIEPSVRLFSGATNSWSDLWSGPVDRNEMYVLELRHFLDCVRGTASPAVTGEEGRRVLEIALAVKQSAREQRAVNL